MASRRSILAWTALIMCLSPLNCLGDRRAVSLASMDANSGKVFCNTECGAKSYRGIEFNLMGLGTTQCALCKVKSRGGFMNGCSHAFGSKYEKFGVTSSEKACCVIVFADPKCSDKGKGKPIDPAVQDLLDANKAAKLAEQQNQQIQGASRVHNYYSGPQNNPHWQQQRQFAAGSHPGMQNQWPKWPQYPKPMPQYQPPLPHQQLPVPQQRPQYPPPPLPQQQQQQQHQQQQQQQQQQQHQKPASGEGQYYPSLPDTLPHGQVKYDYFNPSEQK